MIQLETIKNIITEVNLSLPYYEAEFISLKCFSEGEKERITNFGQFIECCLNVEMYLAIPELQELIREYGGHLFVLSELKNPNEGKYKFEEAIITVHPNAGEYQIDPNAYSEVLELVKSILGGLVIHFTSAPKRMNLVIE